MNTDLIPTNTVFDGHFRHKTELYFGIQMVVVVASNLLAIKVSVPSRISELASSLAENRLIGVDMISFGYHTVFSKNAIDNSCKG